MRAFSFHPGKPELLLLNKLCAIQYGPDFPVGEEIWVRAANRIDIGKDLLTQKQYMKKFQEVAELKNKKYILVEVYGHTITKNYNMVN